MKKFGLIYQDVGKITMTTIFTGWIISVRKYNRSILLRVEIISFVVLRYSSAWISDSREISLVSVENPEKGMFSSCEILNAECGLNREPWNEYDNYQKHNEYQDFKVLSMFSPHPGKYCGEKLQRILGMRNTNSVTKIGKVNVNPYWNSRELVIFGEKKYGNISCPKRKKPVNAHAQTTRMTE